MKIDIKKNLDAVAPWKLIIEWDGKEYPTRRPTLGLVGRFQAMGDKSGEEAIKLVGEIFDDPGPDMETWPNDAILASMSAYVAYFNRESSKNSRAIATAMNAAMAETTPKTSA